MPRRSSTDSSSNALELFLDTICNAFGGIIFISLLVCIMLQLSGKVPTFKKRDPVEEARLAKELEDLKAAIANLTRQRDDQRQQIKALESVIDPALRDQYNSLMAEHRALSEKRALSQAERDRLSMLLARLRILREQLRRQQAQQQAKRDKLQQQIRQAPPPSVTRVRFPRLRATTKDEVGVLLRGGRMVFVHTYDSGGRRTGNNTADLMVTKRTVGGQERLALMPKPGAGTAIRGRATLEADLAPMLSRFSNHYFNLVVWPDSYRQCEILRDLLIEKKFDYAMIIQTKGKPVGTGPGRPEVF